MLTAIAGQETQKTDPSTRQSNVSTPFNTSPSVHGGNSRSNKKKRANNLKANSSTVHAPTSPTPSSKRHPLPKPEMPFHSEDEGSIAASTPVPAPQALPKPERPFCTDDGASLPVPRLSEGGQHNVTLEYNSVEDLGTHFAADLISLDSPMSPSLASRSTIELSSPDMQSYVSRLKGQIDEVLAHKNRGTTLVNKDGSIPLESQERAWGDVLSMYEYPDGPDSRTDPEKWAFWAADFLRPNSTQPSPLIRELGMSIKYFAGTAIKYQSNFFQKNPALMQEYEEGIALVEWMPGSPWAQLKPQEWERLAVDFTRRLMAKYEVSFPNLTEAFDKDTSKASKPKSKRKPKRKSIPKPVMEQGPSTSNQVDSTFVTSILDPLKQKMGKVTEEEAHGKKCGLDTSVLESVREELQFLIDNSPLELTSQLVPKEWEPLALQALTRVIEPPLREQPQKPNVTLDSTEKPSTACSKPPSPTEQAAEEKFTSSDSGSGEEKAIIPPSPALTVLNNPPEEPAGPSGSTSSPPEPVGLMFTCRHQATPKRCTGNEEKQETDVVEGPHSTETELGRRERIGMQIAQENTEENHDEKVSRQCETVMIGRSPEVDKTFGANTQAMDRTMEKEGDDECDNQGGSHERELQATQAVGLDRDCTANGKLEVVAIEEPYEQKQVIHEESRHTTLMDPKELGQDQLTRCTTSNAKAEREGEFSPRAEQKQVDHTDGRTKQPEKQVEIRDERAESPSENKDPATAPGDPEEPRHKGRDLGALRLEVSEVKRDLETMDVKKDATTALQHKEGSTHEGEVSTSPSSGTRYTPSSSDSHFTPPGSEAHSSPTNSGASDVEDNTKPTAKVSQAEGSPLATRSSGPSIGGKKTYAALAKEPASGSGSGVDEQTQVKSDPWAVPQGEQTWGRGKK